MFKTVIELRWNSMGGATRSLELIQVRRLPDGKNKKTDSELPSNKSTIDYLPLLLLTPGLQGSLKLVLCSGEASTDILIPVAGISFVCCWIGAILRRPVWQSQLWIFGLMVIVRPFS